MKSSEGEEVLFFENPEKEQTGEQADKRLFGAQDFRAGQGALRLVAGALKPVKEFAIGGTGWISRQGSIAQDIAVGIALVGAMRTEGTSASRPSALQKRTTAARPKQDQSVD